MRRTVLTLLLALGVGVTALHAQQRFGAITYSVPEGYELRSEAQRITFVRDAGDGTACFVHVYQALASTGDAAADFRHFWGQLVTQPYGSALPETHTVTDQGWTATAAGTQVTDQGHPYTLMLTVVSGHGRTVPIVAYYDHERYADDIARIIEGLDIDKDPAAASTASAAPAAASAPPAPTSVPASSAAIAGHAGTVYTAENVRREVRPDWVELTDPTHRIYLHYTVPIGEGGINLSNISSEDALWQRYVLPYFDITGAVEMPHKHTTGKMGLPDLAHAPARHRTTGASGYVALVAHPENGTYSPVVVFSPSRAAMEKTFGEIENAYRTQRFNYFPISAQRLTGTWSEAGGATNSYYSTATGQYVGAAGAVSSARYSFGPGANYTAEFKGASGVVGAMQVYQQKEAGTFTVAGPHVLSTRSQRGEVTTFDAGLVAVRGGWLLQIVNQKYSGSKYRLAKIK